MFEQQGLENQDKIEKGIGLNKKNLCKSPMRQDPVSLAVSFPL